MNVAAAWRGNPPPHLYKYRSMDPTALEFTKSIIVGNELYFAAPTAFNDPFDTLPAVSIESSRDQRRKYYQNLVDTNMSNAPRNERDHTLRQFLTASDEEILEFARNALLETNAQSSICSMSARNDSVLMWSHYAANHTGICLEFSSAPGSMFYLAGEVSYQRERPVINRIKTATMPEPDLGAWTQALLTKADFWSYEEEWRILRTKPAGVVPFSPERLNGIIFGARASAPTMDLIRQWVAERHTPVKLFKAVPHQDTFCLDIVTAD